MRRGLTPGEAIWQATGGTLGGDNPSLTVTLPLNGRLAGFLIQIGATGENMAPVFLRALAEMRRNGLAVMRSRLTTLEPGGGTGGVTVPADQLGRLTQ